MKSSAHAIVVLLFSMVTPNLGKLEMLTTGFTATNHANGNIFYVKAKDKSLSITGLDINLSGDPAPNPAPVEVWIMPGIDDGSMYDPQTEGPYTKIFEMDIMGQGRNNVTVLPDFDSPVVIPAGATYSFYVTVADLWLGAHMQYNIGTGVGNVYASDEYMELREGCAAAYAFIAYSCPRKWNGNVYYTVNEGPPPSPPPPTPPSPPGSTSPPTNAPTPGPTPNPTPVPTPSPTSHPTKSPVIADTLDPTDSPTRSPTNSPVATTPSPTRSPVDPTNGNDGGDGDGGGAATDPPSPSPTKKPTTSSETLLPTLLPTSSPSMTYEELSDGPTEMLELFLPNRPAIPSSSVKISIGFGQVCALLALFIATTSYLSF